MVMGFWVLGWFVRTKYFLTYLFGHVLKYPVAHDFFPGFLQNGEVSVVIFFLPLLALTALINPSRAKYLFASSVLIVSAAVSMCHLDTYNDATNVTCLWVGVWLFWVSWNLQRTDESFCWQACFLAQLIVGMIFLGGAVGKMTPEYL
ncbi:MAG: hypothetical protein K8I00_00850, partial [Candidatus Omnitrophica bacterium]|nr:hypothetical protein [Candidatus Omnitrophota bacterium]